MCVLDLPDVAAEQLAAEIGGFVALTGGGWPGEQRQEFIDQALAEFATVPLAILLPAIRLARRTVWDPKRFVSFVFAAIAPDIERLAVERDRLERLSAIVVGDSA